MSDLRYVPKNRERAFASPFYRDEAQAIFGNGLDDRTLWSDKAETMRFLGVLSERLTDAFPASIDESGFGGANGVVSNFYPLRTVAGYLMSPATVPNPNNAELRHKLGLADGFKTSRHRMIAHEVAEAMFGAHDRANGPIARNASTSFPFFVKNPEIKKRLAWAVSRDWADIAPLFMKRDFKSLYTRHHILPSYRILMRAQADTVMKEGSHYSSKVREVPSVETALGASTKLVSASKRVIVSGSAVEDHFAQRVRMVYAYTGALNYVMAAIMQRFRKVYLDRYNFTWKHRGAEDLRIKTSQYATVAAFDVSRMDQTVAEWQLEPMWDVLGRFLTEETIQMMRISLHAPCWVPDPSKDGMNHFWTGDPLDSGCYEAWWGIPSGIAPNPDLGKYVMTTTYMCVLDDYFSDVLEFGVDRILRGTHPDYAIVNMSDDTVFLLADTVMGRKLQADMAADLNLSPYMKIEQEKGTKFLGNIYHKDALGKLLISPDIASFFVNWFVPERGTQCRPSGQPGSRQFWALGWRLRKEQYYQAAPTFPYAMEILRRTWEECLPGYLQPDAWARNEESGADFGALTSIDAMVLDDPSKLYYQFDETDVSPQILEQFESGFDEQHATILCQPFFKEDLNV